MARPTQEEIATFVSITGADEATAVRKLEEHHGDLNMAVNAHFNEGDSTMNRVNQNNIPASNDDMMELDGPLDNTFQSSLFPEALRDPFSLMDPNFQQNLFDRIGSSNTSGHGAHVSHSIGWREVPIEVNDSNPETSPSARTPFIEDATANESSYGPEVRGAIVIDDDEEQPPVPSSLHANIDSSTLQSNPSIPTAPPLVNVTDYDNDIEEEMIRAAIEASKKEADALTITSEQGNAQQPDDINFLDHTFHKEGTGTTSGTVGGHGLATVQDATSTQPIDEENSQEENEDVEEQPLVRRRSRRIPSQIYEAAQPVHTVDNPPSSSQPQTNLSDHQHNRDDFPSEWGGISSEEHDEAVMLEAAMFGGIPEGATYPFSIPSHGSSSHYPQVTPPSPALTEQRLLREQQDDEYLASLQADQEKELKALQDAELRRLEETAAREASLEKQNQEEEERRKKQLEEEELESTLASKQASLPSEPPPDNEGAITLVVRMPDGNRQGRRFLRSDKLQLLFDFLDISRIYKPGTYRLVRSYPRRAFTTGEGDMSFSDLGLTSKQEALFLEQITR